MSKKAKNQLRKAMKPNERGLYYYTARTESSATFDFIKLFSAVLSWREHTNFSFRFFVVEMKEGTSLDCAECKFASNLNHAALMKLFKSINDKKKIQITIDGSTDYAVSDAHRIIQTFDYTELYDGDIIN